MKKSPTVILASILFILSAFSFAGNGIDNDINPIATEVTNRVDINQADVKTLSLLKGIGTKKAEAIVKYRDKYGKFTSIDDLLNVSGIGKQILVINKEKLVI